MDRSISYSDLRAFLKCPKLFHDRMTRGWQPPTPNEAVSNALHAIAQHRGDMVAAKRQVDQQLKMLSEADRAAAEAELAERAPKIAAMVRLEDPNAIREKVFRWLDQESGWTLCAKPDRVRFIGEGRHRLLEITDYKDAVKYNKKRRGQLYFFALVLSRALEHNGKIKLVVNPFARQGEESQPLDVFHYSHWLSDPELRKIRGQLARIEEYMAGQFPATPDWFCSGCPLADTCQEGRDHQERANGRQPLLQIA